MRKEKNEKHYTLDLTLHADPVMNATTNNSAGNDLSQELRTYYDRNLLDRLNPQLVYSQFGQKRPIPKNGGQTINFRRFESLGRATTPLVEGVTPEGSKLNITKIEAEVKQYGAYVLLTDWLQLTAPDPIMTETAELLGDNAGETLDVITREVLMTGTNVYYGDGTVTSRAAITKDMKPTLANFRKAKQILDRNNVRKLDGGTYVAIIHPDTWADIAKELEDLGKYTESGVRKIYQGEIGTYQGIRFVETSLAKIFPNAGAAESADEGAAKIDVYATLVLGKDAFGISNITDGGIETIAKQLGSSGTSDPLNQRSSMGWKANRAVVILSQPSMIRLEHASATNFHESN